MSYYQKKPPLGLMPESLHREKRLKKVRAAIKRFYKAGHQIPIDWVKEYNELIIKKRNENFSNR